MNCGRKSLWTALAVGGVMAFASGAFGSTNVFLEVRTGVGAGGTSWLKWTDKANWKDPNLGDGYANEDSLGRGFANLARIAWNESNGRYIELPTSLTLNYLMGAYEFSISRAPVLRGDGELIYKARSTNYTVSNLGAVWLYTPYVIDVEGEGYSGFNRGRTEICAPLTRTVLSGDCASTSIDKWNHGCRNGATVHFNYAAYATEQVPASGERTISDWTMDYLLDNSATYIFTAPCGSSTNLVCTFDLTADSPFAKRETGASGLKLPVGTAVTGDGIADGTYLKRIFPDGSIELSQAATNTATASLTFAAVTYKAKVASAKGSRLRAQNNSGNRTIKVNKSRAEDDFEVTFTSVKCYLVSGSSISLTFGTDTGYLPGRVRLNDTYRRANAKSALNVILQDCEIVPPETFSNCDAFLKVPGAAHTARINVDTETTRPAISASYKTVVQQVAGTLVKTGVGTWPAAFTNAVSAYTGKVVVEEGTLKVLADSTMGTVEVKAGATLDVSAGNVSATQLIVEEGAIISGGALSVGSVSGDLTKVVFANNATILDPASATGPLTVELESGAMLPVYEASDSIAVVTTNSLLRVTGSGVADVLVVGGGGGAGAMLGAGGGGGGGVIYQKSVSLTAGWYPVTVGNGGRGAFFRGWIKTRNPDDDQLCGEDSAFLGLVAKGGGCGGNYSGDDTSKQPAYPTVKCECGVAGGSGGGGGVLYPVTGQNRDRAGGAGTAGQGYAGAKSWNRGYSPKLVAGGGGGGAGGTPAQGGQNSSGQIYGSAGGDGLLVPIWGQRYWGGGGGGSAVYNLGTNSVAGGKGGGGAGRVTPSDLTGYSGEPNTGGGGGAGSSAGWDNGSGSQRGGAGGSGVVIIRFTSDQYKAKRETPIATGGKVYRRSEYFTHSFTESGTFKIDEDAIVDVLVVGGGGGGGMSGGGGGAGGGVVMASNVYVKAGSYAVTVGAGGKGQTAITAYQTAGGASSVNFGGGGTVEAGNYSAPGGGYGGFRYWRNPNNAGGSGGGGGAPYAATLSDGSCWSHNAGAAGVAPYFKGGDATNYFDKATATGDIKRWSAAGGGGGGAGGAGGNAWYVGTPSASNRAKAGVGGAGIWCDYSGYALEYGKGGDGGAPAESTEEADAIPGADGADGSGQGGGGSTQGLDSYLRGGNGGSGVVLIRYRATYRAPRGLMMLIK